jgi:hypothetical protein
VILDRLRDYVVAAKIIGDDGTPQSHLARFPSPQWNIKSWSFRLVEDLLLKRALHRSRLADGSAWKLRIAARLTANAFSYHDDAEYKGLLHSALMSRADAAKRVVVVLPEVGPFGFDLLIARCAGFQRFVAYDKDAQTIELCRAFHRDVDVEYMVSTSAAFDADRFASADHLVVFPDWPHDQLEKRLAGHANVVRYSFRSDGGGLRQARRRLGAPPVDWASLFDAMDRLD